MKLDWSKCVKGAYQAANTPGHPDHNAGKRFCDRIRANPDRYPKDYAELVALDDGLKRVRWSNDYEEQRRWMIDVILPGFIATAKFEGEKQWALTGAERAAAWLTANGYRRRDAYGGSQKLTYGYLLNGRRRGKKRGMTPP